MSDQEEEPATNESNEPEQNIGLTEILRTVQDGHHEAHKAHNRLINRLEKLSKQISDLGERMDVADQFSQNPFASLFPADMQLRITSQAQADGTPSLSLSVAQPDQAQPQLVQDQAPHAAATADGTPNNDANAQAAANKPRRNPTRAKPATEHTSTSTKQQPAQANRPRVKSGYEWENSFEKRVLPPSPPKITSVRPSKPKVNRRGASSAKGNGKGKGKESSDDDGIDEIPARADQRKVHGYKENQQKSRYTKTTGDSEANDDADGDDVALGAENADKSNNDQAPAQTAMQSKKRKTSQPDQVEDAEDEGDEAQRPKKKGKKSKKAE
ncbi:hypothetical protein Q7P35_007187 [Cladosporium inversicolor]